MNDKITFPRLSTMLADRSGRSKRFSEEFLREFFSLISERLEAGESVKVKGLGIFRLSRVEPRRSVDVTTGQPMEISGHSKVVFVPAKELAEAVNAPFEAFTAIEISDDTDLSRIFTKDEIEFGESEDDFTEDSHTPYESEEEQPVTEPADEESVEMPSLTTIVQADNVEKTDIPPSDIQMEDVDEGQNTVESPDIPKDPGEEETHKSIMPITDETESESSSEQEEEEDKTETEDRGEVAEEAEDTETDSPRMKTWVKTLLISLGAAVVALIATFAVWYVFATNDFNGIFNKSASNTPQKPTEGFMVGKPKQTEEAIFTDSAETDTLSDTQTISDEADVPTAPSDALVYDTISTTRYLTTMAKVHYGNYNLWPYIYEENKAILGHPDRIRPGTAVVIPKLSKFGIDPTNDDDVEKAKKMGVEIYARYGKKI
ncbi:MAG: HU family DNA-binding protein [Muribaculaceae bacterium]|nr:HU family DNA-binding protein [Muribaculaceae bacterium]